MTKPRQKHGSAAMHGQRPARPFGFLEGGGEMGAWIRAYDWDSSELGPFDQWPQSLRTTIGIMLNSAFPHYLVWGPNLISFYNDAYVPIMGTKENGIGKRVADVWPEAWTQIAPLIEGALAGEPCYFVDLPFKLERNGFPERACFTFSYSPIRDEQGEVGGVLCIIYETTQRALLESNLKFRIRLGKRLRGMSAPREVTKMASELLGRYLHAGSVGYAEFDTSGEFLSVETDWTDGNVRSLAGRHSSSDLGPLLSDLKAGRTIRLADTVATPPNGDAAEMPILARNGIGASLAVPLIRAGRLVSSLWANQSASRNWRDDEVELIEDVAERTWEAVERARAEARLRESEEYFRRFAEHSTNVLWIVDLDQWLIEYASPAFERVWGRSCRSVLLERISWLDLIHPDDREPVREFMQHLAEGNPRTHEHRILREDGSVRWIRSTPFLMLEERDRVRRAGGISEDLTGEGKRRIYLIEPDQAVRQAEMQLLRQAGYEPKPFGSVRTFSEVAPVLVPGCVLLCTEQPKAEGLAILRELRSRRAELPIIAKGRLKFAIEYMKAGAADYIEVPYNEPQLLTAIASALAEINEAAERDQAAEFARTRIATLSAREHEVFEKLLAGGTNKTIARALGISPRTVEIHRSRVMGRLGAQTLAELMQMAASAGLLQPLRLQGV